MINQSRRKILKNLGYGLALSASGTSTIAMALPKKDTQTTILPDTLPSCDITIHQQQTTGKEIVSLMNLTGETVKLDSIKPVGLEHVNGSLVVKLNNVTASPVSLVAGERLCFEIEATSTQNYQDDLIIPNVLAGHVKISSSHPAFNGIIPVTIFDGQMI